MIITERIDKEQTKFEEILEKSYSIINSESISNPAFFQNRNPVQFEHDVCEAIREASKKTDFEGTIELISGHKFPDIIAKKFYGVEVKTTKQDQWKSTGNSILETTRVENIERIYIFFGKLTNPVGFKYRKYEECLYDVAVTHSPRYLIDMNLALGNSIFDKLNIPYDDLRNRKNPIKPIIDYYRSIAKNGEEPWWMDSGDGSEVLIKPTVSLWCNLESELQKELRNEAMARFPEIFGKSSIKYQSLASWLAARHGIVHPSLRDIFTAGGQVTLKIDKKNYNEIPHVFKYLHEDVEDIIYRVKSINPEDAKYHWKLDYIPANKNLLDIWIEKIIDYSSDSLKNSRAFIIHLLSSTLGSKNTCSYLKDEAEKYGI